MEEKFYPINKKEIKALEGSTLKKVLYNIQNFKDEHCSIHYYLNNEEFDRCQIMDGHRNIHNHDTYELELPNKYNVNTNETSYIYFNDYHYVVKKIKYGMYIRNWVNGLGKKMETSMLTYELYIEYDEALKEDPNKNYIVKVIERPDWFLLEDIRDIRFRYVSEDVYNQFILERLKSGIEIGTKYGTVIKAAGYLDDISLVNMLYKRGYFDGHILSIGSVDIQKVVIGDSKKNRIGYFINNDLSFKVYEHVEDAIKAVMFDPRLFEFYGG